MKLRRIPIVCSCLIAIATGCAPQPEFDTVFTRLDTPSLTPGSEIPSPKSAPILTVSGRIEVTNRATPLRMDLPTIESVGLVEYTVLDPFEKVERTFTGVLMKDLLALWQVPPDATVVNVEALNDYAIDIPIELLQTYPVIFALMQDGEYMTPDYRGPAMLVFPYNHYEFDLSADSYWVWQIETITVK